MKQLSPLTVTDLSTLIKEGAVIADTRDKSIFSSGFIPGSIFTGLDDRIKSWGLGFFTSVEKIIILADEGMEKESMEKLSRAGLTNIVGYLEGGFNAWQASGGERDMVIEVEADELLMDMPHDPNLIVLDVRRQAEFAQGHIPDAMNIPVEEMNDVASFASIEDRQNLYIHSFSGYRSLVAASVLKKHGYHNLRNVTGGWEKIKAEKNVRIEKDSNALN